VKLNFLQNILKKIKTGKEKIHGPYKSCDEMFKEQREWEKKHPILTFFKRNIYYPSCRFCHKVEMIPKEIKWFWQRGTRGWADSDVWSIDWFLCDIMPPMLKQLKKNKMGYPCGTSQKKWEKILDDIAYMFETAHEIQDMQAVFPEKKKATESMNQHRKKYKIKVLTKEEFARYNKGWKLFQEYFYSLWD